MTDEAADLSTELLDAAVELLGRTGQGGTLRVQGCSMQPTLRAGQLLRVEFTTQGLRRGELLLYRQDGYLVVHRLVGRRRGPDGGRKLVTRGDGVLSLDPPLDPAKVLGRIVALEDGPGWRELGSRGARLYAWCVAWHGRAWDGMGRIGAISDRILSRAGLRPVARSIAWRLDRALLRLAHGLLFPLVHRKRAS